MLAKDLVEDLPAPSRGKQTDDAKEDVLSCSFGSPIDNMWVVSHPSKVGIGLQGGGDEDFSAEETEIAWYSNNRPEEKRKIALKANVLSKTMVQLSLPIIWLSLS